MALSKRLLALYAMVKPGSIAADIGCDHAQLAISLVENGICDHVYASDLRSSPLSIAKQAVKDANLSEQIFCSQRDGLEDLAKDVDTVLIAGMGFDTIHHILTTQDNEVRWPRRFIIQTNTHPEKLRQWISQKHYTIDQEDLVWEDRFYEVIAFHCGDHEAYCERECRYGVFLVSHPLYEPYLRHRLDKIRIILDHLPKQHEKYLTLHKQKMELLEILADFEH